eukprot:g1506.t1
MVRTRRRQGETNIESNVNHSTRSNTTQIPLKIQKKQKANYDNSENIINGRNVATGGGVLGQVVSLKARHAATLSALDAMETKSTAAWGAKSTARASTYRTRGAFRDIGNAVKNFIGSLTSSATSHKNNAHEKKTAANHDGTNTKKNKKTNENVRSGRYYRGPRTRSKSRETRRSRSKGKSRKSKTKKRAPVKSDEESRDEPDASDKENTGAHQDSSSDIIIQIHDDTLDGESTSRQKKKVSSNTKANKRKSRTNTLKRKFKDATPTTTREPLQPKSKLSNEENVIKADQDNQGTNKKKQKTKAQSNDTSLEAETNKMSSKQKEHIATVALVDSKLPVIANDMSKSLVLDIHTPDEQRDPQWCAVYSNDILENDYSRERVPTGSSSGTTIVA